MASATRVQLRSRPTKRPMVVGNWSTGGSSFTITTQKSHMPKQDERCYPTYGGILSPTHVDLTVVA